MASTGGAKENSLPVEVTDNIIDHLHDDVPSLQASALVCGAWLPSCRFHLFASTLCMPGTPGRTVFDLLQWASDFPDPAAYIRELSIACAFSLRAEREDSHPEVAVADIRLLLQRIPTVRELTLRGVRVSSPILPGPETIASETRPLHLSSLTLVHISTPSSSFVPICQLLAMFSDLETLTWANVYCSWDTSIPSTPSFNALTTTISVKELLLLSETSDPTATGYEGILELHSRPQTRWPLTTVTLGLARGVTSALVGLLRQCQQSVRCLSVWTSITAAIYCIIEDHESIEEDVVRELWRVPELQHCSSLETLALWFLVPTFHGGATDVPEEIFSKFSECFEYSLWASSEILLSAPPTTQGILLVFVHIGTYSSASLRILEGLRGWDALDKSFLRFHSTTALQCAILKKYGEWIAGPVFETATPFPARTFDGMALSLSEEPESDDFATLLMRKLPRAMATGRMTIALG